MALSRRRAWRAQLLRGLEWLAVQTPAPLLAASLRGIAPLARFTRYERTTLENLERVFGSQLDERARRELAARVRQHVARQVWAWLQLSKLDPADPKRGAWLEREVEWDASIERLWRERRQGRGLLIVTAHLGDWELLCARLARAGLEGAVVGYQRRNDPASAFLPRMRRAYGVQTLDQSTHPRRLLEVLQRGQVLGLVSDLAVQRLRGERLDFLGLPAHTISAPAALARASGLPLIPVRCVYRPALGRYRLMVEEPLEWEREGERRAAARQLLQRQNDVFGRWIREDPEQWAWHQPRWRAGPSLPYLDPNLGQS